MIINHNMNAMNAHRNMSANTVSAGKSMEKLSSGLRINKAGDDAAGLAISEKMRGQIRGLDQASRNAQDGISMIQTAEGALNETHSILQRMRELSVQASNDTNTLDDRKEIQKEMNQLTSEINRIGSNTEFNTQKLLDGNKTGSTIKVGDTVNQVQGVYTLTITGGSDVTVGGQTFTFGTTAGTEWDTIGELGTLIDADATFNAFTISTSGTNKIVFTQTVAGTGAMPAATAGGSIVTTQEGWATHVATSTEVKDGSASLQIGANNGQQFTVDISDMRAKALSISGTNSDLYAVDDTAVSDAPGTNWALDVRSASKATAAIATLDNAIKTVSGERSKLGAYQNRLDHTIANLGTASENLTSAESRIRDVDMAKEMMSFSKNNILSQAAQAMLAQANQQPQGVLQLLR